MPDADAFAKAYALAVRYLSTVSTRHVGGQATRAELLQRLGGPLPLSGSDAELVIEAMAKAADPGLVATAGPRYFGFVTGGAVPVTVAADWLASAWDQNAGMYVMSPAVAVMEDVVSAWLLELLALPATASVGFVTGAHMASFTCLAAARHEMLRRAGWNVEDEGLQRAPRLTVLAGEEVHVSVVGALRMLGIGARAIVRVGVDGQGRIRLGEFASALAAVTGPVIICTQVGNVNTGASDPVAAIVDRAHEHGAWVHVDGAFGLWAHAVPEMKAQVHGLDTADSWATDAHKWLNVPYDSGLAVVAHPAPHRAAMNVHASYLTRGADEQRVGMDWVPESSRRARVVPMYALLRALGRDGVQEMVRRTCARARQMADRLSRDRGIHILNEVVLNQVLVRFDGAGSQNSDEATRRVVARVQAEGTCWAGSAVWQGRQVMRISVSNWSTSDHDIDRSARAIIDCYHAAASSSSSGAGPAGTRG